jgi:hypothetical protein
MSTPLLRPTRQHALLELINHQQVKLRVLMRMLDIL